MLNVIQCPNLRHLGESLRGAEGLLEAVSFKKATEGMGRGRVVTNRRCRCVDKTALNFQTSNIEIK